MGSNKLCGLYGLGCQCPCRTCLCNKFDLLNPSGNCYENRSSEEAKVHLEIAFQAFCKKMKKKKLIDEEKKALEYCESHSIYPIMLAVMNMELPFEGFSAYEYFRQDLMHTLLGRFKTWVFSTICILYRMSKKLKGKYRDSLSNLDDALINFLPNNAMAFPFYHFQNGVTSFCLSSTDSKQCKLSTSGLGKIDYSRMVSLVLQMLLSINERDDIICAQYRADDMPCTVKTAVLGAGWCLLDAYLSLNRKKLTSEELSLAGKVLQTANYATLLQHCYKQILLNNPTFVNPKEIKPHYSGHLIEFFQKDGSNLIYNTTSLEAAHKFLVKDTYRHSSMRKTGEGLVVELYNRMSRSKLLRTSKIEFEKALNLSSITKNKEEYKSHVISVETEAGVVYECSKFSSDRQALIFDSSSLNWKLNTINNKNTFLSPICTMSYLIEQCYSDPNLTECLNRIKINDHGNTINIH